MRGIRIQNTELLQEGFCQKFVFDIGPIHLLDEGKDLYDFGIALMLEESLCEHENEMDVFAIIQVEFSWWVIELHLSSVFEVGVD